jgi:membrane protein DedA with SNARE-associated domain/membrane-associated phospholipid phosphatase
LNYLTGLLNHYGYIVLFVSLMLELIAFPTPGETLMTYCGFLVFQGKLNLIISIIAAALGVTCGITISYFLGRILGNTFLKKYGLYIHLGPERLEGTSKWFERYGNGLLVIAFFIPGVRHVTGYFSGITKIPYKRFALNAYIGAFIWTGTFISLGNALGLEWHKFHGSIRKYLIIVGIILTIVLICIYLYKNYKDKITESVINCLEKSIKIFHSLGEIKVIIAGMAVVFIVLSVYVVSLIQDVLGNEFIQFDTITIYLVSLIFSPNWSIAMSFFKFMTSANAIILLAALLVIWILVKGKNRFHESCFVVTVFLGAEVLEIILRVIFHRMGPSGLSIIGSLKYTFPSQQALMAVATYGFTAFMILRHVKRRWLGTIAIFIAIFICILTGLSSVFYKLQYPSDVIAGYAFGGIWLSLNIILMEVFRIMLN